MRIRSQDKKKNISSHDVDKHSSLEKRATTDINILLNRVKLNKKRDQKKNLIFFSLLVLTISLFTIFTIF